METIIEERKKRLLQLRQQYANETDKADISAASTDKETKHADSNLFEGFTSEEKLDNDLKELKSRTDLAVKLLLRERLLKEAIQENSDSNANLK
ncbi:unnamed protein product [Kluyveromyces dobzhanskii CBS 2104]|uniref:WGS project CCBQ000000000 data, contig 00006 n=1 Tax=Kluyveromyces dobzhanskii CBS 2104 TaxID=1427455 RepID=A0A0A8L8C6_9SACH|nr:unnamed protein product [Kluyveromyces dobzhanskii CBS 2104]